MSDIVKLIIEIPKESYQDVVKNGFIYDEDNEDINHAIRKGTPLDDVKAEIEHMACRQYEHRLTLDRQEVIEILDNIGKTESEDKE